jgi:Zn-finger nucleic acid-binding protein
LNCPIDTTVELVMTDRQGIEIDYCPRCRGVWLDRGELDKLIERGEEALSRAGRDGDDRDDREREHKKPRRKRESFLGEMFDFG